MSSDKETILFDLDGTLVDSSAGILRSLEAVLESCHIDPIMPIDSSLIGPPLKQTLIRLTGIENGHRINQLVDVFKAVYDSEGYQKTVAYPGLTEVLATLRKADWRLFIVTNKRMIPLQKILDWLKIRDDFIQAYALDAWQPAAADKVDMVGRVLHEQRLDARRCLLVGDSSEDMMAAVAHHIMPVAAAYGYGDAAQYGNDPSMTKLETLRDLLDIVNMNIEP